MRRATIALDRIEPGLAELVLADPDLSLPAKLALLYVLSHADQVHDRQELSAVDELISDHLDEVLHELVGRHWLATVPPYMLPCLASSFARTTTRTRTWTARSSVGSPAAGAATAATALLSSTWTPG